MTFPCAIAPLDQSATQLGWHQGTFTRRPCPLLGSCMQRQDGLQFRADVGTPVVAPFDGRFTGGVLTGSFTVPGAISVGPPRVRIDGVAFAAPAGPVQKGALLGRVARASRPAATFTLEGGSVTALFAELGLDIVGGERRPVSGFALTPFQGGRLLVRASGPANCSGAVHGLEGFGLGADVAPAGYVEPDASVYGRFGVSRQTNTSPLEVPGGSRASGGLWSLVGWITVGGMVWAATKR